MKKRIPAFVLALVLLFVCTVSVFAVETPYADSQFLSVGAYSVHYRVIPHEGEYQGRILFLHGFLCSTYAWRNMAAEMSARGYDCVLADLPNFGYTTRETPELAHTDREDLMKTLMDTLAPGEEWILAGHSMGGGVAVNIAEEYPVRAVLLYCPAVQSTAPENMSGLVGSRPMRFLMNTFFKVGTRLSFVVRLVVAAATWDWNFGMQYDVHGVTDPFLYDGIGSGMCTMITSVRETNLADAGKVTAPVLLVEADKDIILDGNSKTAFSAAFPNAVTYTVAGGGHQCIENRASELAAVTADFLAQK